MPKSRPASKILTNPKWHRLISACLDLGHSSGVQQLLQAMSEKAASFFQSDGTIFFLHSDNQLIPIAWTGLPNGSAPDQVVVSDAEGYVRGLLTTADGRASMSAVMETGGKRVGEVVVFSRTGSAERYDDEARMMLALLAHRVATAVEDARFIERMRGQQEALARIASALTGEVEVRKVAQTAVDLAVVEFGADGAIVWQAHSEQRALGMLAVAGFSSTIAQQVAWLSFEDPSLATAAATTQEIQVVEELDEVPEGRLLTKRPFMEAGMRSAVSVPLVAKGRLMGVLNLTRKTPHRWAPGEQTMVKTVGDLLASAVFNARLFEESERRRLLAEAIIDNSPVAIAVTEGAEKRYVLANATREQVVGIPRERIVGRTFAEVFPDLVGTVVSDAYDRVLETGESVFIPEFRYDYDPPAGHKCLSLLYAPLLGTGWANRGSDQPDAGHQRAGGRPPATGGADFQVAECQRPIGASKQKFGQVCPTGQATGG